MTIRLFASVITAAEEVDMLVMMAASFPCHIAQEVHSKCSTVTVTSGYPFQIHKLHQKIHCAHCTCISSECSDWSIRLEVLLPSHLNWTQGWNVSCQTVIVLLLMVLVALVLSYTVTSQAECWLSSIAHLHRERRRETYHRIDKSILEAWTHFSLYTCLTTYCVKWCNWICHVGVCIVQALVKIMSSCLCQYST